MPAELESARIPDIENGETNSFNNRNALKYNPCIKNNQRKSSLTLRMITNEKDDEEVKNTKILEFNPARKPEEARTGDLIRFMYSPRDDSSLYWLQGILNRRVDKYEIAKKSGWKLNRFRVDNISVIKRWGDLKPLPEIITVNLTKETAWSLGTEVESTPVKKDSPTTRIRLGYDAIKDMDLKGDTVESHKKRSDGYSHMIIHEYEVNLSPFRGRLGSRFGSSFKDSKISVIAGGREEETRQNLALPVL